LLPGINPAFRSKAVKLDFQKIYFLFLEIPPGPPFSLLTIKIAFISFSINLFQKKQNWRAAQFCFEQEKLDFP